MRACAFAYIRKLISAATDIFFSQLRGPREEETETTRTQRKTRLAYLQSSSLPAEPFQSTEKNDNGAPCREQPTNVRTREDEPFFIIIFLFILLIIERMYKK